MERSAHRIELIGGFRAFCGSKALDLPFAAQRVVAFLAVRNRPVARIDVASSLWYGDRNGAGSLRTALWTVQRRCPHLLRTSRAFIALSETVSLDFQAQAAAARRRIRHPEMPPDDGEVPQLEGELLPGWPDSWARGLRAQLLELRVHALEGLSSQYAASGDIALAIDALLVALEADPLRESTRRALISAHADEGNLDEARRQYEACVKTFGEHGVSTSHRLQELAERHALRPA